MEMKHFLIALLVGLAIIGLIFVTSEVANAEGFGISREGDSTVVTVNLNNARDSAWVRFAYGGAAFYDSVRADPLSGTSNTNLKSGKLDLDSIGSHYVEILTFTSDAVADTIIGTWFHQSDFYSDVPAIKGYLDTEISQLVALGVRDSTLIDTIYKAIGWPGVSYAVVTLHMKLGAYDGTEGSNVEDDFDSLSVDVAALSGGTGANLCSLYIYNGNGFISTASVTMTKGSETQSKFSNSAGWAIFSLDDGTWTGVAYKTANTQDTIPQTFSISADLTDSITMTAHTPAAPSSANLCNVYGYTWDMVGDTVVGATFRAVPRGRGPWRDSSGTIILVKEQTTTSDDSGYVSLNLYKSYFVTNPNGDSLKYDWVISKRPYFEAKFENRTVYADSSTQAIQ